MKNTQGILLYAAKHAYYGNYAWQLAASIKFACPDANISIITDGAGIAHLSAKKKNMFDKIIDVPKEYFSNKGMTDYFKVKTFIYDLSPYSETIFLDADMLWCPHKSIQTLFDEFNEIDFTMSNRGCVDVKDCTDKTLMWANAKELVDVYQFTDGKIWNISSEFIYLKKKKEVKKLFKSAQKNYETLKISYKLFGGDIPDELPFTIAILQNKIYPHIDNFAPAYWCEQQHNKLKQREVYEQYYLASFGGNYQGKQSESFYNSLAGHICNKFGERLFPLKSKRSYLQNRTTI